MQFWGPNPHRAAAAGLLLAMRGATEAIIVVDHREVARPRHSKAAERTRAHLLAPARTLPTGGDWLAR